MKLSEPSHVSGKVAATIWLTSYMEDSIDLSERIERSSLHKVTVTSRESKDEQNANPPYPYVVHVNYDIVTYSDHYVSSIDGGLGKGTFTDLCVERYVKSFDNGNFALVSHSHQRAMIINRSEFVCIPFSV